MIHIKSWFVRNLIILKIVSLLTCLLEGWRGRPFFFTRSSASMKKKGLQRQDPVTTDP